MFYTGVRGLVAVGMLAILGLILIWKGVTGDVMTTRLGDTVIPRWMYIVGGVALLAFPVMFILVRLETGRALLGLY